MSENPKVGGASGGRKSRAQRLVEMFQRGGGDQSAPAAPNEFKSFASKVQQLNKLTASAWSSKTVSELTKLVSRALEQTVHDARLTDPGNAHAEQQLLEQTSAQMRQLALTMQPPAEVVESPEFQALMEMLQPRKGGGASRFEQKSALRGKIRSDLMNRQVSDAVKQADRKATAQRIAKAKQSGADQAGMQNAGSSLAQMARLLRKRRKKKRAVEPGEVADVEPEEITPEEAEELAGKALETMKILREELAPKWAPGQQPWFVNASDNEVFSVVLAAIPKELFEETEAFQQIQDLRAGQEVFTLRASEKTSEAVRRK